MLAIEDRSLELRGKSLWNNLMLVRGVVAVVAACLLSKLLANWPLENVKLACLYCLHLLQFT